MFRAYPNDYTNSGYDRGHMAPAGDAVASQAGMDETFLLTNIAPQIGPGFNRQCISKTYKYSLLPFKLSTLIRLGLF